MKVYEVAYLNGYDDEIRRYFTNKKDAVKHHNYLLKKEHVPVDFDDETEVNTVYPITDFEFELTKSDIMELLNRRFI